MTDREAVQFAAKGKAEQMWKDFTPNEKTGVRFGMFPHQKMLAATKEGHDSQMLAVALMDVAKKDGGMRA